MLLVATVVLVDGSEHEIATDLVAFRRMPFLGNHVAGEGLEEKGFPYEDVPWRALMISLVLVILGARAVRTPADASLPAARVRRR